MSKDKIELKSINNDDYGILGFTILGFPIIFYSENFHEWEFPNELNEISWSHSEIILDKYYSKNCWKVNYGGLGSEFQM